MASLRRHIPLGASARTWLLVAGQSRSASSAPGGRRGLRHVLILTLFCLGVAAAGGGLAASAAPVVATGVVMAHRAVDIAAKQIGRITTVGPKRGDRVAAGDMLIELDTAELRADRAAAGAEVGAARVESDWRTAAAARLQQLADRKSLSTEQLDEARYSLAAAGQRLVLAQARLAKIDALLAETRLSAPFAAVVVARNAEVGQLTQPGERLLRLEDHTRLELHARVNELDIVRIRLGDRAQVEVDALGDAPLAGTVAAIIPSGDLDHTFLVEIALPARDGLYPGMFGKARFGD